MLEENLSELLKKDTAAHSGNNISEELLKSFDNSILAIAGDNDISREVVDVYKKFIPMKQNAPEGMKNKLFSTIRNFAQEQNMHGKYFDSLILLRFLILKSTLLPQDYFLIAENFEKTKTEYLGDEFIRLYIQKETNKPLLYLTLGNFYNLTRKDYKTAIKYYEKYLEIDKTKSVVYTILSNLYQKVYGDESLKEQIFYLEKAYKLKPDDRLILHGLAFGYEKLKETQKADKFYKELLNNNPTTNDFYNYGLFLISCGDFLNGHKYLRYRNSHLDTILNPDKKWDMKSDISNKILLIHYEEGFGDTFMYCRFVPFMKNFAQKVIFAVQDNLFDLIKNSPAISDGIEIISDKTNMLNITYDYYIGIFDLPFALKTTTETIPYTDKYLEVLPNLIEEYNQKYIKTSDNMKIGIAYHGDLNANYNGRDLKPEKFNLLFNSSGIDFYSLQYEETIDHTNVTNLGKTFKNFTDTACAIKNMDLVITTDNVILNLAGSLGVNTIALFNKQTNYRWFKTSGDNSGWYKYCKPLQVSEQDDWAPVLKKLVKIINEIKVTGNNKKGSG